MFLGFRRFRGLSWIEQRWLGQAPRILSSCHGWGGLRPSSRWSGPGGLWAAFLMVYWTFPKGSMVQQVNLFPNEAQFLFLYSHSSNHCVLCPLLESALVVRAPSPRHWTQNSPSPFPRPASPSSDPLSYVQKGCVQTGHSGCPVGHRGPGSAA